LVYNVPLAPRHRKNLGQKIRFYRKANRLTQEKLAEKAELAPSYVSDVERGCVNISVDALQRIATTFGVQLRDLFEEK
jgi:XRE family transcriptional regulator, regulator of sulfur utilization